VKAPRQKLDRGPFRADQIAPGDPYELSHGHPVRCAPTGGTGAGPSGLGFSVTSSDPAVEEAGVDVGYAPEPDMLRAPDVAVGNVPPRPGWIRGAPFLAIEYADVGQNEQKLEEKIADLLEAGTKYLWVVRLAGPRRVEVHEPGNPMRTVLPGEVLLAPGVLKNPVLVEALYDRAAAERATLTNLLQRQGYEDLDAVLAEGRAEGLAEGRAEGLRAAVRGLCEVLSIPLTSEREAAIARMQGADLEALHERLKRERRWP
jgi:Uma2 family endonuclease